MSTFSNNPLERGMLKTLELEDEFDIGCVGCGDCCRGRFNHNPQQGIFLSGPDVARMARCLNKPVEYLIEKYLVAYFDADLSLYFYGLKFRDYNGSCRLLTKGKCTVYKGRPRTCALFPLARELRFSSGTTIKYVDSRYHLNLVGCNNHSKKRTVNTWLIANEVPLEDKIDIAWFCELYKLSIHIQKRKKGWSDEQAMSLLPLIYADLDLSSEDVTGHIQYNFEQLMLKLNSF